MRSVALLAAVLATALTATPTMTAEQKFIPPAATEAELVTNMTAAAKALAAALPPEELKVATFTYGGKEHKFWHYIPTALLNDQVLGNNYKPYGRFGVPVEKMSPDALEKLHRLLRTALSIDGYQRFMTIVQTEGAPQPKLGINGLNRSPTSTPGGGVDWYFFSLFGAIGEGTWGWRFEGHHFSLSMEVADGHVRFSPVMVGYNPWPQLPIANIQAVKLFAGLSKAQQAEATIVAKSPDDGIPKDIDRSPKIAAPVGALLGKLDGDMQYAFNVLVDEFIGTFPDAAVGELRRKIQAQTAETRIAWYGTTDPATPYFVRIQGPTFLIQMRHNGIEATGCVHGHLSYHGLDASTGTWALPQ
jgi:hypothetical protein